MSEIMVPLALPIDRSNAPFGRRLTLFEPPHYHDGCGCLRPALS